MANTKAFIVIHMKENKKGEGYGKFSEASKYLGRWGRIEALLQVSCMLIFCIFIHPKTCMRVYVTYMSHKNCSDFFIIIRNSNFKLKNLAYIAKKCLLFFLIKFFYF